MPTTTNAPKVVSFFAGIGGFDLAFERAGFECVLQVEIEPNAVKFLAHKFNKPIVTDIRAIPAVHRRLRRGQPIPNYEHWKRIFELLATADVFCGGWPCQDLSVAGQRAGLAGERSGLWFTLRRIIALFRPAWFVGENVPGLLSSQRGECFSAVVCGLEKLRYGVCWRSLDAQYFGVAQRRERVFLVASAGTLRSSQVLFEPESLCGDPPPSREAGQNVAPTVEGRAGRSGANNFATAGAPSHRQYPIEGLLVPATASPVGSHHCRQDLDNDTYIPQVARSINSGRDGYSDGSDQTYVLAHGQTNAEIVSDGSPSLTRNHEAPILIRFDQWQGGNTQHGVTEDGTPPVRPHPRNAIAFTERTRAAGRTFESQEELSYAVTDPVGGGQAHARKIATATMVRRLTPTECLKLQGFAPDWLDGLNFSDSVKYRLVGNAVCVPVVEWIARRLLQTIDTAPKSK